MSGVRVLGRRAIFSHGAIGGLEVTAIVGHAGGSQRGRGPIADVTISRQMGNSIGYGVTVDDPAVLDAAAAVLTETAQALRAAQAGAAK